MRKSFHGEWLKNQDGTFVGVNLGADYCAEHEHGISTLKSLLGINESSDVVGIEKRRITKLDEKNMVVLNSKTKKGYTALVFAPYFHQEITKATLPDPIKPYRGQKDPINLSCGWSERDFGIYTDTQEGRQNLQELIEAIKNKDVAVWTGGGGVFKNAGLCIAIVSKVSPENKDTMQKADEEALALSQADARTGIKEKLKEAKLGYYALSPNWSNSLKSTSRGEITTKHEVVYFLNPMNQKDHNYGWFTVEDLEQWIQGRGPILKQPQTA